MSGKPSIAIDGPAGAGKSTVGKELAARLGLDYVDTGAMYRCVALKCGRSGVDLRDGEKAAAAAGECRIDFHTEKADGTLRNRVFLDGVEATEAIRLPEISEGASVVSTHGPVRRILVERQKEMGLRGGVVMEGRDIGTVVMPEAPLKIFLTASCEERARRRLLELSGKGIEGDFDETVEEIRIRDERDSSREDSPLRQAEDAVLLDTQGLTLDEVVEAAVELARARGFRTGE